MNTGLVAGIIVLVIAAGAGIYFVMSQQGATEITTTLTTTSHTQTTTQAPQTTNAMSTTTTIITSTSTTSGTETISTTTTTQTTTTMSPTTTQPQTTTTQTTSQTATTTTTSPQTVTTTTVPPTSTTTVAGTTVQVSQLTLGGLLGNFTHVKVSITATNASTGEISTYSIEFTKSLDTVNGQQVLRIDLTFTDDEGEQTVATIWVTQDFQNVVQVEIEGQIMTGPYAEIIGRQILQTIGNMFLVAYTPNFEFYIQGASAELMTLGWRLDTFQPTQVTISGITYSGYYFKVTNVNDAESNTQSVEGKIVELHPDFYYMVYMKVVDVDGNTYEFEFTELTPAG